MKSIKLAALTLGMTPLVSAAQLPALVEALESPNATHVTQTELLEAADPFTAAFDAGDELFNNPFNALDGVGANVGNGQRFTRVPRADLPEWMSHFPPRPTGPNAEACNACHRVPVDDGSGDAALNVIRDPFRTGNAANFINRNTPLVLATGALQRLAEEMTEELHAIRDNARQEACRRGRPRIAKLETKGVDFGSLIVNCRHVYSRFVVGVDEDLVVKPFQWKGSDTTLRQFTRDAAHRELGMQALELVGDHVDGDFDGVRNELTVGDVTAIVVYNAAQARPVSKLELDELGLIDLTAAERQSILRGQDVFDRVLECTSCHVASMTIDDPIFSEPSQNPNYRDAKFPSGAEPLSYGLDPANAISYDLTYGVPDNVLEIDGETVFLGGLRRDGQNRAIIEHYSDLKRHYMGSELAESIDEVGTGRAVWMTKELWGVGSTAPYLHDGRATTLTEAILAHGGEAYRSRTHFQYLPQSQQQDLLAFLESLIVVLFGD